MEQKLKKLFDYQQFEQNEKLEKMIRETENRYARELTDDELEFVNAAGDPENDKNPDGNFGIYCFDDCHYKPSRFENAFDPDTWSRTAECARCVYNSNRFWEYSTCTYEEKHKK